MSLFDVEDIDSLDPLDILAEEFADRCRRGEWPSVEEYVARKPELAESIRPLFATIAFLEKGRIARTLSDSSLASAIKPPLPPPLQHIGGNRIVRELGRGGMGIVYEAEQENLGRRVAVKVLPGHAVFDEKTRLRFLREAKAVAKLQHPNIVPIHSVGEERGIPYYVMALVEGMSLDRLIVEQTPKDLPAHARWVAQLGRQAALALAFAHEQGVLHRDIKPSNLLLDQAGTLWLADFGLAKFADDLSLTGSGELPGTLRYLAPECLRTDGDERSDVYSLGLTLYEILLGQPAFSETNRARLLRQIQDDAPSSPRTSNSAIPRDLDTIISKAMERDPEARYATAAELAADLSCFLQGKPIQARPISHIEQLMRRVRRNLLVTALAATSIILALFGAYFFTLFLVARNQLRPEATRPPPGPEIRAADPRLGDPGRRPFPPPPPPPRGGPFD